MPRLAAGADDCSLVKRCSGARAPGDVHPSPAGRFAALIPIECSRLGVGRKSDSVVVMRTPLFRLGFAMFSSVMVVAAVACGGGKDGAGPKAPENAASDSKEATSDPSSGTGDGTSGSAAASGSADSPATGTGGTTTTTQLGDGGDLQGAKLGGSVHTTTESKGEGGPKSTRGQSASEPGRTAKDIQTIVMARRDEARACYDKALAAHPGIEGDLDI